MQTQWNPFPNDLNDNEDDVFNIGATISQNSPTQPDDVVKTKSALKELNSYEEPSFGITEIPDRAMIDGIKKFQSNNGLKVDGVMKPGGPTQKTLNHRLKEKGVVAQKQVPKPDPIPVQEQKDKEKLNRQRDHEEAQKLTVNMALQNLLKDEHYPKDEAYLDHVRGQFEKAYPGEVQYDDTGKMIQPKAVIGANEVEVYNQKGTMSGVEGEALLKSSSDQDGSMGSSEETVNNDTKSRAAKCGTAKAQIENAIITIRDAKNKKNKLVPKLESAKKELVNKENDLKAKLANLPIDIPKNVRKDRIERIIEFLEKVLGAFELALSFRKILTEINEAKHDVRMFTENIRREEKTIAKYEAIKKLAEKNAKKYCD